MSQKIDLENTIVLGVLALAGFFIFKAYMMKNPRRGVMPAASSPVATSAQRRAANGQTVGTSDSTASSLGQLLGGFLKGSASAPVAIPVPTFGGDPGFVFGGALPAWNSGDPTANTTTVPLGDDDGIGGFF